MKGLLCNQLGRKVRVWPVRRCVSPPPLTHELRSIAYPRKKPINFAKKV